MEAPVEQRQRAKSSPHQLYLNTLIRPSSAETRRISEVQLEHEALIQRKYHSFTAEEHAAAKAIQAAYRGHRDRRQLDGLTLDPSQRWVEAIREMRYRAVSAPHYRPNVDELLARGRSSSYRQREHERVRENWARVGEIARHAGGSPEPRQSDETLPTEEPPRTKKEEAAASMLMDSRYFLEMTDLKHRYGANLQSYHEQWLRSKTNQSFFYWLDHGDGKDISVPGCTREKLDKERIRYLSREERRDYLVHVDDHGLLRWEKNDELITTSAEQFKDSMHGIVHKNDESAPTYNDSPTVKKRADDINFAERLAAIAWMRAESGTDSNLSSSSDSGGSSMNSSSKGNEKVPAELKKHHKRVFVSPSTMLNNLLRATVKPGTWIYVMDTVGRLYVGIKSSGAFQHASFLSGSRIASAGSIRIEDGKLTYLAPLSGHYRPTTKSFRHFIKNLKAQNVDVSELHVSGSYSILLAMEFYGKTSGGVKKVGKHKKPTKNKDKIGRPTSLSRDEEMIEALHDQSAVDATDIMDAAYDRCHSRRSLTRMLAQIHMRKEVKKAHWEGQPT